MAAVYKARERERTTIPLADVLIDGRFDILPDVQAKDYFNVRFQSNELVITAGKYVGLIPINDRIVIDVEPKMPIANMLAILAAVEGDVVQLAVLQREYGLAEATPAIMEALAGVFVESLHRVEVEGILKQYRSFSIAGPSIKGSVRFGTSLQSFWSRGVGHAAVSEYFDLTSDLADNRLLRFASQLLLLHHINTGQLRRSVKALAHFDELFARAGIESKPPDDSEINLKESVPSYKRAIGLARMVVKRQGIELRDTVGGVSLPSFLVDMETLFEQYTRHALLRWFTGVRVLDGNADGKKLLFDSGDPRPANPDVVFRATNGDCVMVVDAKYKSRESREDINQVLTYAMSYRTKLVALILPAAMPADSGMSELGRVDGVVLCRYRFDLAASNLDAEERRCAVAFQQLIPGSRVL